ncbi:MAG: DUF1289 domain-containing protein [Candidatus Puniceispirillaceae bacterium]
MSEEKLASPCISICQINPVSGNCSGCYRTRTEIANWRIMSAEEQKALLDELGVRRANATGVTRRKTRRRSA